VKNDSSVFCTSLSKSCNAGQNQTYGNEHYRLKKPFLSTKEKEVISNKSITARPLEFTYLWTQLQTVDLCPGVPDQIEWKLSANGEYSTKSAYMAQFLGDMDTDLDQLIWKARAPPKCKIFALWTANWLDWKGWPNQKKCPLCRHTDESALHLFAQCRYTICLWAKFGASVPAATTNIASWDTCDSAAH
jgi:hypothetical protein